MNECFRMYGKQYCANSRELKRLSEERVEKLEAAENLVDCVEYERRAFTVEEDKVFDRLLEEVQQIDEVSERITKMINARCTVYDGGNELRRSGMNTTDCLLDLIGSTNNGAVSVRVEPDLIAEIKKLPERYRDELLRVVGKE